MGAVDRGYPGETVVMDVTATGGQQPGEKSLDKRFEGHDACTSNGSVNFYICPVHEGRHVVCRVERLIVPEPVCKLAVVLDQNQEAEDRDDANAKQAGTVSHDERKYYPFTSVRGNKEDKEAGAGAWLMLLDLQEAQSKDAN